MKPVVEASFPLRRLAVHSGHNPSRSSLSLWRSEHFSAECIGAPPKAPGGAFWGQQLTKS